MRHVLRNVVFSSHLENMCRQGTPINHYFQVFKYKENLFICLFVRYIMNMDSVCLLIIILFIISIHLIYYTFIIKYKYFLFIYFSILQIL